MVIKHTNVAKDREKLKRVLHAFMEDMERVIDQKTKDDKMKGWEDIGHLLPLRRKLRDLATKATVGRTRGLEADIVLTACLIKYLDDEEFRQHIADDF